MLLCEKFVGPHFFEGGNTHGEGAAEAEDINVVL
jgi:hypothetical protein